MAMSVAPQVLRRTPAALYPTPTDPTGEFPLSIVHINGGVVIRPRQASSLPRDVRPLTQREREVLALVAEGYSNKRIARHLGISERTVKQHLTWIMTKLQASDRTHAVVTAVRLGWLAI